MATYYVELNGGELSPKTTLKGGGLVPSVQFSGAQIYPTSGSGGANLETKSVSYTPSETAISDTLLPDPGYDGFDEVDVSVGAIPSNYVGSAIPRKSSPDLTVSGATVTAPSGYYSANATKTMPNASPLILSGLAVQNDGTVEVDLDIVSGGYIPSQSDTLEAGTLSVQPAQTITPTTTNQTIASGKFLTGAQTILGDPNLIPSNIVSGVTIFGVTGTASGGDMSNDVKDALLTLASKVAYIDDEGQQAYMNLLNALYPLDYITATYTQSGTIYTDDTLADIRANGTLVVTAIWEDGSTTTIDAADYTLSGSLISGTSVITVTYLERTTTFNVTVTAPLYSIPDFAEKSVTVSNKVYRISKSGNYFTIKGKASASIYVYPDGTCSETAPTTTLFTVQVGDEIHNTADVTSWANPTSTAITAHFKYSRTDTTGNLYTATCPMAKNGSGSGGVTDYDLASAAYARPIGGFAFQFYDNPGTSDNVSITFRPKFFINGVRYF